MLPTVGYRDATGARVSQTIDAVARNLREGDFVYRYRAADGVGGGVTSDVGGVGLPGPP